MIAPAFAVAISVVAGAHCLDVRAADGGCLVAQEVAAVFRYGAIHGAFLANDFPNGGLVVGASFGGDVGSPFFSFAHDRVRLAARLTLDQAFILRPTTTTRDAGLDFAALTFVAGPQLWIRLTPAAFFVARAAAGGTAYWHNALHLGRVDVLPTVDGFIGFAFPLD